jgi:hypothetical protein
LEVVPSQKDAELICAMKNSMKRCAARGVGANGGARSKAGDGATINAAVMAAAWSM